MKVVRSDHANSLTYYNESQQKSIIGRWTPWYEQWMHKPQADDGSINPAGSIRWPYVEPMLGQRRRRWTNIGSLYGQSILHAGLVVFLCFSPSQPWDVVSNALYSDMLYSFCDQNLSWIRYTDFSPYSQFAPFFSETFRPQLILRKDVSPPPHK